MDLTPFFYNRLAVQTIQDFDQPALTDMVFSQSFQVSIPLRLFFHLCHDLSGFSQVLGRLLVGAGLDLSDQPFGFVFPDGHRPIRRVGLNASSR
jgi:hypothetical protein